MSNIWFSSNTKKIILNMWNIYIFVIALLILILRTSALSFNQPKFCPTASWNINAVTFANESIVGMLPVSVSIDANNTIYVARGINDNEDKPVIVPWHEDSINPTKLISGSIYPPRSLFVTSNGDIYIDGGRTAYRQVKKWIANQDTFVIVMNVYSTCYGLFVDINDTLYCSMFNHHQVVKRSLNNPDMTLIIVAAGTGSEGSAFNQLNLPWGIFVDVNFDLYVADSWNDRVQLFQSGESNGITVAGSKSPNPTINLLCPSGIVLDADKYLFIVDHENHRIVRSSFNGFQCLVGCDGRFGTQPNNMWNPSSFSFDRSGNMLVADTSNNRIQKFEYFEKSCEEFQETTTSSASTPTATVASKNNNLMNYQQQKKLIFYIIFFLILMLF